MSNNVSTNADDFQSSRSASPRGRGWRPAAAPSDSKPAEPPVTFDRAGPEPVGRSASRFTPPAPDQIGDTPVAASAATASGAHVTTGRGQERVRGEARAVRQRSERFGETAREVWTFRVERYDDRGNRLPPVLVEMRGLKFDGGISEGDRVAVSGRWRDGTLVAERVHNETTNSLVRAKSYRGVMIVAFAVVAALVVVMIVVGVMVSGREGRARDERRERLEQQIQQNRQDFERQVEQDLRAFCEQARRSGITPPNCR